MNQIIEKNAVIIFIIICIISAGNLLAGELDVGAVPAAVGNAYTAIANGPLAIYWNPANLAEEEKIQVEFSYKDIFNDGMFYGSFIGLTLPVYKKEFTGGVALYHVGADSRKNYYYSENTLLAGSGMKINEYILLGISGKVFFSTFGEYKYSAADVNASVLLKIYSYRIAIAGENLFESPVMQAWTKDKKGHFNRSFRIGSEIPINVISVLVEAEYVFENIYTKAGLIYNISEILSLMGGVELNPLSPSGNLSSSIGVYIKLFNNIETGLGISNKSVYNNYVMSFKVIF